MKRIAILMLASVFIFAGCSKKNAAPQMIKGKYVYSSCASSIIQVLDPQFQDLGVTWQRYTNDPVYQHAFGVANLYDFRQMGVNEGDVFYFKVLNQPPSGGAICTLWDNPPSKQHSIQVLQVVN